MLLLLIYLAACQDFSQQPYRILYLQDSHGNLWICPAHVITDGYENTSTKSVQNTIP